MMSEWVGRGRKGGVVHQMMADACLACIPDVGDWTCALYSSQSSFIPSKKKKKKGYRISVQLQCKAFGSLPVGSLVPWLSASSSKLQ